MREILFRGKRLDTGEWVEGSYLKCRDYLTEEAVHIIAIGATKYPHNEICGCVEVDPATVGQFTGFTVNGTKVFEGDIISVFDVDEKHGVTEFIGEVFMDSGSWLVSQSKTCDWYLHDLRDGRHSLIEVKVIGNIHDNPELLEGGADNEK